MFTLSSLILFGVIVAAVIVAAVLIFRVAAKRKTPRVRCPGCNRALSMGTEQCPHCGFSFRNMG